LVAIHGYSYFFVALDPGQHAVCTDWQSGINTYSRQSAATSFNAEAGKISFQPHDGHGNHGFANHPRG
jgi:hypothetical protein